MLAVYFASNGVEALRAALEPRLAWWSAPRRWYWLRLESIGYTLVAVVSSLAMAFLDRAWSADPGKRRGTTFILRRDERTFPERGPLRHHHHRADRAVHPACLAAVRPPQFSVDTPGIIFTLIVTDIRIVFGQYLARFANNYVTMYAGLASVIALVFLVFPRGDLRLWRRTECSDHRRSRLLCRFMQQSRRTRVDRKQLAPWSATAPRPRRAPICR